MTQIDPATDRAVGLKVGGNPSGIAIVRGEVWTTNELAGTVSRVDPATLADDSPCRRASVWACTWRRDRLRGAATDRDGSPRWDADGRIRVARAARDARFGSLNSLWQFAALLTNEGLLAYRHVGGQAWNQLVPDLARSMPQLSADRKTYTFQLRPNIRYSNGRPLRASDFRCAIEPALKLRRRTDPAWTT